MLGALAVIGMAMTVLGELVLIPVAAEPTNSGAVSAVSTAFGVGLLLADIGLVGYGTLALRQRRWTLPWRGLPLTYALLQLLVVTPVSLSSGFASTASYVVIATADLLVALIGLALLREPVTEKSQPVSA